MNYMQIIQMIRSGQNPEQIVMQMLQSRMGNTPMGKNLMQLAQTNNTAEIEKIARNIMAQKGIDYDKEMEALKKQLGL